MRQPIHIYALLIPLAPFWLHLYSESRTLSTMDLP